MREAVVLKGGVPVELPPSPPPSSRSPSSSPGTMRARADSAGRLAPGWPRAWRAPQVEEPSPATQPLSATPSALAWRRAQEARALELSEAGREAATDEAALAAYEHMFEVSSRRSPGGGPITARSPVTPQPQPASSSAKLTKVQELLQEELVRMPSRRTASIAPAPPTSRATPLSTPRAPLVEAVPTSAPVTRRAPLWPGAWRRVPEPQPTQEGAYYRDQAACTRQALERALAATGGNKRRAAREIGMSRPGFYKALKRVGLPTVGR